MPTPIAAPCPSASAFPVVEPEAIPPPPTTPRVITLEPVYIEGDAGARQLVAQHDRTSAAKDCLTETRDATVSSIVLGGTVLATAAAIATGGVGLLVAGGLMTLFGVSIDAGAKLGDLRECKKP